MSLGGILGAAVGGVVGFFIGGPAGALYGASIGFGIGSFLDPISPDVPAPGNPAPDEAVMKSTVGDPCGDLCGTAKITGHLLAYGNETSVPIYQETSTSGGKGGPPEPEPQITGYDYYMSWQLGICEGPVDTLHAIYRGDDLLWEGPLNKPTSTGKETIAISGFGSIDFYFGTDDQTANSGVASIIGDSTLNSPLRHFCWAFMNNCKIGNYPRTPTLKFIVSKIPSVPYRVSTSIQTYDMVPMAVTYYILNTMCGLPTSWLNDTDFGIADSTLRLEFRGISVYFKDSVPALTYLNGILSHVDAVLKYGSDGQFHPKLIRDDYTVASLPTIDEDDLLDDISLTRPSWIGTVNEIKTQYTEIYNVDRDKTQFGTLYFIGINGNTREVTSSESDLYSKSTPTVVPDIEDWKVEKIMSQDYHTILLRDDGLVYTRGKNSNGQCGQGTVSDYADWGQPTIGKDVPGFWSSIGTGVFSTFGIDYNGNMWACGVNNGNDFLNVGGGSKSIFVADKDGNTWFYAAGGFGAGVAGHRLGWGVNSYENDTVFPSIFSNLAGIGGGYELGYGGTTPFIGWQGLRPGDLGNIVGLWAGNRTSYYAVGVATEFDIYSAGQNNDGQLGQGFFSTIPAYVDTWALMLGGPWKSFDASYYHCIGIKTDGTLWACGLNANYQLGQNDTTSRHTMTQLGSKTDFVKCCCNSLASYAIDVNGAVWACGYAVDGRAGQPVGSVKTLTREQSEDEWINIWKFRNGLFLIK